MRASLRSVSSGLAAVLLVTVCVAESARASARGSATVVRRASGPTPSVEEATTVGTAFDLVAGRAYMRTGFNDGQEVPVPSSGQAVVFHFDWRADGVGGPATVNVLAEIDGIPFCAATTFAVGGDSFTTFCSGSWTATTGRHTLRWEVDYTNSVAELREGNNRASHVWTTGGAVTPTTNPSPSATRTSPATATRSRTATPTPPTSTPTRIPVAGEDFYPRGDADCSVRRTAADVVATVLALHDGSLCDNDDCDRDGVVDASDVDCAARCLFGRCPVPQHAPRVDEISPTNTASIAPYSAFTVRGENFGSEGSRKRVLVDGVDVEVAEYVHPDTIVAVLPDLPPGSAQVSVVDGDVAGVPVSIHVASPAGIGQADTFEGTMDSFREAILAYRALDLDAMYGEAADQVRLELDRAVAQLGDPLEEIVDSVEFEEIRDHMDFALEVSGLPEALRGLTDDLRASETAGRETTEADRMVSLAYQLGTVVEAAAKGARTVEPTIAAVRVVKSAVVITVTATGPDVTLRPALSEISYFDADGGPRTYPTAGGTVRVGGYNLFHPAVQLLEIAAETKLERRGVVSGLGQIDFRVPEGIGICGRVAFRLRQSDADVYSRTQIWTVFEPELLEVLHVGPIERGQSVDLAISGVLGCEGQVTWKHEREDETTFLARSDVRSDTPGDPGILETTVPNLPQGDGEVLVEVHRKESETLPIDFDSGIRDLQLSCADQSLDLISEPTTTCRVTPFPRDKGYPVEMEFEWRSTDAGVITIEGRPGLVTDELKQQVRVEAEGLGQAEVRVDGASAGRTFVQGFEGATIRVFDRSAPRAVILPSQGQRTEVESGSSIRVMAGAFDVGGSEVASLRLRTVGDAVVGIRPRAFFSCPQPLKVTCSTEFIIDLRRLGYNDQQIVVTADAVDTVGNTDTSAELVFTIEPDRTPPTVSLSTLSSRMVPRGGSVLVQVDAEDNESVQRIDLVTIGDAVASVDPGESFLCPIDATPDLCRTSFTITFRDSGFSDSDVTVRAEAPDRGGNKGTSNTLTFEVGGGGRSLRGTVREVSQEDREQRALADAVVQLFDSDRNLAAIDVTDGAGEYRLVGFWDENIIMTVTKFGLATGSQWFDRITTSTKSFLVAPVNPKCTSTLGTFDLFSGAGAPGSSVVQVTRRTFGVAEVGVADQVVHPDAASLCVSGGFGRPTFDWNPDWLRPPGSCESRIRLLSVNEWLEGEGQWSRLWSVEIPVGERRALVPPIQYGDAGQGIEKGSAVSLRADGTFYNVQVHDGCGFRWGLVYRSR